MAHEIILNGKKILVERISTIGELLREYNIDPSHVVVEVNRNIIKKEEFDNFKINENDIIEILRFVGGG